MDPDYIKVAGKNIPIKIYELIKRKDGGKEDKKLIKRISLLRNRDLPEDWDGIFEMRRK